MLLSEKRMIFEIQRKVKNCWSGKSLRFSLSVLFNASFLEVVEMETRFVFTCFPNYGYWIKNPKVFSTGQV